MNEYVFRNRISPKTGTTDKSGKNNLYQNEETFKILKQAPYAFYSFGFYYKKGDLIQSIECMENINKDYLSLYLQEGSLNRLIQDIKIDLDVVFVDKEDQLSGGEEQEAEQKLGLEFIKNKLEHFVKEVEEIMAGDAQL